MEWLSLLYLAVASVLAAYLLTILPRKRTLPRGAKLAPGPSGLPILGHLPFIARSIHEVKCRDWAKIYGPIVRINMCYLDVVVLNDLESIRDYFCKQEVLNRPSNWLFKLSGIKGNTTTEHKHYCLQLTNGFVDNHVGLGLLNGHQWRDNRRFSMHVMRDLGYGKTHMEQHVMEESQYLADKIAEAKGEPVVLEKYLNPSASNIMSALLFGARYPYEDPRRTLLDNNMARIVSILSSGSVVAFPPAWFHKVAGMVPFLVNGVVRSITQNLVDFVRREIKQHLDTLEEHTNRDFIDGYLKKITKHKHEPETNYTTDFLVGNIMSFFIAGSNTVAVSIQWHLLNFAKNPDTLQARVHREIDEVIGRERRPAWDDRHLMPFTIATIWEMYRWRTNSPFGLPRGAEEDTYFGEYFVPKGTVVLSNLWAVHMDPDIWKNPEEFNPSRFFTEDGSRLAPKPDHLIPFALGKRMCPGETLSTMEIFLFLTTILQRYRVDAEEGREVELACDGAMSHPIPGQRLRFIAR
ncbi:cytochrome P450 2C15-like [Ixodes scapularis]|uniref:cytochrome P450 2C15-like n=1 Tax=Ixodes scapularis TaxID=6945 RepID=UPI001C395726|nr:cytochrome P450 2C15-like [Ixodes scapularis]